MADDTHNPTEVDVDADDVPEDQTAEPDDAEVDNTGMQWDPSDDDPEQLKEA